MPKPIRWEGERIIAGILNNKKIVDAEFAESRKCIGCYFHDEDFLFTTSEGTIHKLRPDFYVVLKNGICLFLEFDGIQHYQFPHYFHKTEEDFLKLQKHDKIKDEYWQRNNLPFLRVSYLDKAMGKAELKIEEFLQPFIKGLLPKGGLMNIERYTINFSLPENAEQVRKKKEKEEQKEAERERKKRKRAEKAAQKEAERERKKRKRAEKAAEKAVEKEAKRERRKAARLLELMKWDKEQKRKQVEKKAEKKAESERKAAQKEAEKERKWKVVMERKIAARKMEKEKEAEKERKWKVVLERKIAARKMEKEKEKEAQKEAERERKRKVEIERKSAMKMDKEQERKKAEKKAESERKKAQKKAQKEAEKEAKWERVRKEAEKERKRVELYRKEVLSSIKLTQDNVPPRKRKFVNCSENEDGKSPCSYVVSTTYNSSAMMNAAATPNFHAASSSAMMNAAATPNFHAAATPNFHAASSAMMNAAATPNFHAAATPNFHVASSAMMNAAATPNFHVASSAMMNAAAAPNFHVVYPNNGVSTSYSNAMMNAAAVAYNENLKLATGNFHVALLATTSTPCVHPSYFSFPHSFN